MMERTVIEDWDNKNRTSFLQCLLLYMLSNLPIRNVSCGGRSLFCPRGSIPEVGNDVIRRIKDLSFLERQNFVVVSLLHNLFSDVMSAIVAYTVKREMTEL
jgi:hypothetical protein